MSIYTDDNGYFESDELTLQLRERAAASNLLYWYRLIKQGMIAGGSEVRLQMRITLLKLVPPPMSPRLKRERDGIEWNTW